MNETEKPKMQRVDCRLPQEVIIRLEARALDLGVSVSELVRWMVIRELDRTRREDE